MKKNLLSFIAIAAVLGSLILPTKKAEAGVILASPLLGLSGIALGGGSLVIYATTERANDQALTLNERISPLKKYLIASMALFILDSEKEALLFETVPDYLIQEIKDQAAYKAEALEANDDGIKEVVFTHAEVDDIFVLADTDTSQEELDNLRELLTTQSLQ